MIPIVIKVIRNHSNCRTINDRPNTASRISSVSQIAAVTPAGKARNKLGCVAPCEKTKTFCTPNGKMSPNAKMIP